MNTFYQRTLDFQEKVKGYAANVFRTYGRELVLPLEDYNLLQNKHNCFESSTAIGFVLEEFLVSKLEMYTHCDTSEYVINRFVGATSSESFDCYSIKDGTKFMVNVKAEKVGQQNNALAEIGQLHSNSIFEVSAKEISFDSSQTSNFKNSEESDAIICFLLKLFYSARNSYFDSESGVYHPNHIYLENVEISCLTESQH